MATEQERAAIMDFTIMVFTVDLIAECVPCETEASMTILLAASYGPSKTETD